MEKELELFAKSLGKIIRVLLLWTVVVIFIFGLFSYMFVFYSNNKKQCNNNMVKALDGYKVIKIKHRGNRVLIYLVRHKDTLNEYYTLSFKKSF